MELTAAAPGPCILLREGHRPKMFLWMIEEYVYILSQLRASMTSMDKWSWVMNSFSSHATDAAGREVEVGDHALHRHTTHGSVTCHVH